VFRYLPDVDAFDVTPEYRALADLLGLAEWNPVVWIGRLFTLDNDVGEHWFDNWDAREARRAVAEHHGLDANNLLIVDPDRFQNGVDGPCNTPEFRARFWHDVLVSLELSPDLLFDKAREMNRRTRELIDAGDPTLEPEFIPDLEERISAWRRASGSE
jgi:hypothetical protein